MAYDMLKVEQFCAFCLKNRTFRRINVNIYYDVGTHWNTLLVCTFERVMVFRLHIKKPHMLVL